MNRNFSKEELDKEKNEIKQMRDNGMTLQEIAIKLNRSIFYVYSRTSSGNSPKISKYEVTENSVVILLEKFLAEHYHNNFIREFKIDGLFRDFVDLISSKENVIFSYEVKSRIAWKYPSFLKFTLGSLVLAKSKGFVPYLVIHDKTFNDEIRQILYCIDVHLILYDDAMNFRFEF